MKLEDIKSPQDIKQMNVDELNVLAKEIRSFLVQSVSKTGGHLSSNLGIVELTIALHYVYNSPTDKIFFDVGHQCYVHKLLTGRYKEFKHLRQYNGMSGFQKRKESIHDVWEAGHSSTSLSAALGFAIARDLKHQKYNVLPVIGDGAMASGMSFEALNQIGSEQRGMVIVYNDNNMSISKNPAAMNKTFTNLRSSKGYATLKKDLTKSLKNSKVGETMYSAMKSFKDSVKEKVVDGSIFTELNIDYIGPVDGHDIEELIKVFTYVKDAKHPILVHVITKKGKGYKYAENDTTGAWHGVSKFNTETGKPLSTLPINNLSWSSVLSETLIRLARINENIVAITPAMMTGSKLEKFAKLYPNRFFDCGIAEEHATTFAASLALNGERPFLSIYSSFLQRAYDQVNHDVARMDLPVVFGVDRSGLVGEDGETHHGVFDISMLYSIPNIIISEPKDAYEAQDLMYTAFMNNKHPFFIRIPRGSTYYSEKNFETIEIGAWTKYQIGDNPTVCVISYGNDIDKIINKAKENNIPLLVVNARFIKPLDTLMLDEILSSDLKVITYETDIMQGGLSSAILSYMNDFGYQKHLHRIGIKDHYVPQGSLPQLRKREHIDLNYLFEVILDEEN